MIQFVKWIEAAIKRQHLRYLKQDSWKVTLKFKECSYKASEISNGQSGSDQILQKTPIKPTFNLIIYGILVTNLKDRIQTSPAFSS